jgi:hypothetical protein
MTSRQKRIIFIVSASVLLIILAVGVILIKLNAVTDTERAKAFLQTMYTVTAEESSELLTRITSGSLTAEMTEQPLRKKYGHLMTPAGFQEAVESRAIWSNETALALNQCAMTPTSIQLNPSPFTTPDKPAFTYEVTVKVQYQASQEAYAYQPRGTLYLEKSLNGWKISRLLVDETSSVAYQLQIAR